MQPKADMVLKECGYMDSMTFSMLVCNGKGWWTYTNAVFFSSRSHDLPTKLKLRNNQTIRNVGMWM